MVSTGFLLALAGLSAATAAASTSMNVIVQLPEPISKSLSGTIGLAASARLYSPDGRGPVCLRTARKPTSSPSTQPRTSGSAPKTALFAPLTVRDTFEFAVPECDDGVSGPGTVQSFLLSTFLRDWELESVRIDVRYGDGIEVVAARMVVGNGWNEPGPPVQDLKVGLESIEPDHDHVVTVTVPLTTGRPKEYYIVKSGFAVLTFLKNPMVLMTVGTLFLAVVLPWFLNLVAPELVEEFKEFQEMRTNGTLADDENPLSMLMGGGNSKPKSKGEKGKADKEDEAPAMPDLSIESFTSWISGHSTATAAAATPTPAPTAAGKAKKGKRRG